MRAPQLLVAPALALLLLGVNRLLAPDEHGPLPPASPSLPSTPSPRASNAPIAAASTESSPSISQEALALSTPPVLPSDSSPGSLGHWHGRLLTHLRTHAPGPQEDFHLPVEFEFPLALDRRVRVRVSRFDFAGPDSGVFIGTVPDEPGSTVVLSYVGLAQSGLVHLPDRQRSYVIQGDSTGHIRITENDLSLAPGCTQPLIPPTL